jgi:ABC-type enterochelin transport system permease subunit
MGLVYEGLGYNGVREHAVLVCIRPTDRSPISLEQKMTPRNRILFLIVGMLLVYFLGTFLWNVLMPFFPQRGASFKDHKIALIGSHLMMILSSLSMGTCLFIMKRHRFVASLLISLAIGGLFSLVKLAASDFHQ